MYSIKPGRGPSMMGAIGAVVAVIFGIFWIGMAASMGAPVFFVFFGVIFILMAVVRGIYSLHNATGRNRFSNFDITTDEEESDPVAEALDLQPRRHRNPEPRDAEPRRFEGDYCPFCGAAVDEEFDYCPKCGKDI